MPRKRKPESWVIRTQGNDATLAYDGVGTVALTINMHGAFSSREAIEDRITHMLDVCEARGLTPYSTRKRPA